MNIKTYSAANTLCRKLALALPILVILPIGSIEKEVANDVESMLKVFAEDFQYDPFASQPITFVVRVEHADPQDWTIVAKPIDDQHRVAEVTLSAGLPSQPAPVFVTNPETLGRLYRGDLHSLTAGAKARSDDFVPLELDFMEDFAPTPELIQRLIPLYFHFWTRGQPEIIPWGRPELSRVVHGANAGIFYYQPGFRSGWFYMTEGQHANKDEAEQVNPFPTLIIMVKGSAEARIGGKLVTITGGESLFIGAGISHEFWNENKEPAVGIILMFGEGA